jgi:hypothetical protein
MYWSGRGLVPGGGSADSSTDWLSSGDLVSGAAPAPAISGLNLAISYDGYSLFSEGNATADTTTRDYGLAIAYGDGASADATGIADTAIASGTAASATASGGNFDTAMDVGADIPFSCHRSPIRWADRLR